MDYIKKHISNKYLDNTLKYHLLFFDRYIDKVIYINLKEAVERNNTIINNLKKYFHEDKIIRLDAIKNKYKGATQSHIECLNIAIKNNWKNVLIIEDDAVLINKNFYNLEKIIKNSYDVIHLGATFSLFNPFNFKLYSCFSGTAYIVNNKYFKRLRDHYIEGLGKINNSLNRKLNHDDYVFDSYWRILQSKDNWKVCYPPIFIQHDNYSYINERQMTHKYAFYENNIKFIINRYKNKFYNFYKLYYFDIFNYLKISKKNNRIILFIIIFPHYIYLNFKQYEVIRYIFNIPIFIFLFIIFLLPIFGILNDHIKYYID